MGFIMLKSSQAQITQLNYFLEVYSIGYKSYVKNSEIEQTELYLCFLSTYGVTIFYY